MKKRGYFFTLDAFIAGAVLAFGLIVIFSSQVYTREPAREIVLSDSTMKLLGYTKVDEVNNEYVHGLIEAGNITNLDNTIMQQAGEFYYRNQNDRAAWLIGNATPDDIPPKEYGLEVRIEGETIFNRSTYEGYEPDVLSSSKIIISSIDLSTKEMWGPYKAEVNVWRS
jgi:hypothetical protein